MINIENLQFRYPGTKRQVFDGFSLNIQGGGIYGLLGKNGTGKSTLLYLISGLLRAQQGSVSVDGHDSRRRDAEMLQEVFIVPEEYDMPDLSLRDFISLQRMFYPRFSEEVLAACLRGFEMPEEPNLSELSMGQKKKVYMSMALASGTRLLLMDEPTNGLDIPSKALFRQVVSRHMTDDRTLIISTHQVHDIEALLDHVLIIDDRGLRLDASMADLMERYTFSTRQQQEMDDSMIYAEPTLQGNATMAHRQPGDAETAVNLEILFSAVAQGKL